MEVLHRRCAGLDVHKKTVVACIRIAEGGKVKREVREFGTATRALYALAEWLTECGCSHAAMESTGVYWKPVWHVLEVSWAGLCPRLDESAGKARSTRTRHGHWLKTTLVQAAWAAVRKQDNSTYMPSSCASKDAVERRERSSRWPRPCSRPRTT